MSAKAGRNDDCPCGSGKKFKKCCELKQANSLGSKALLVIVGVLMVAGLVAGITSLTNGDSHTGQPSGVWSAEHGHYH